MIRRHIVQFCGWDGERLVGYVKTTTFNLLGWQIAKIECTRTFRLEVEA